jgi:hypothetical protein
MNFWRKDVWTKGNQKLSMVALKDSKSEWLQETKNLKTMNDVT